MPPPPSGPPPRPDGLDTAGGALWDDLTGVYDFTPAELVIVAAAARQADDVARVEAVIAADGAVVPGSKGQPRLSAAITEARQGRVALAKLIGELAIPADDDDTRTETARTRRARHAANARWQREARKAARGGTP